MAYVNKSDIYKLFDESNGVIKLHIADVDMLPIADVEEVKHGHWISTPHSIGINKTPYECSRCGMAAEMKYEYCNCGAKMDGGKME